MAHEHAGKSIIEMLWEQLDIKYAELMEIRDAEEAWTETDILDALKHAQLTKKEDAELWATHEPAAAQIVRHLTLKGNVQGLAYALAKLRNPLKPNLDEIRKEVAERYVPPDPDDEDEEDE